MRVRGTIGALLGAGLLAFTVVAGAMADTEGAGSGTAAPGDNSWLLIVALGVLVASIVVLTPRRSKRPGSGGADRPGDGDGPAT